MDVENTHAPTCTCPSGDGSLRSPCPAHGAVPAINLQHEPLGFVLFPLSPAAVAPHVAEYIIGFDFDEVRDVYGERFGVFWRGLVGMFAGQSATVALPVTGMQQVTGQQAPPDLGTSEGARRFVNEFFATELRRHDFADYISTRLAADFACALAQYLAAGQPGAKVPVAQVRQNGGHTSPEVWFYPETFYGTKIPDGADLFLGPPAQGIDLHRLVPPEWLSEQLGSSIDDLTPGQAWRQGFNQCRARALLLVEQAMGFPAEQQCDAVPGVDRA